MPLRGLGLAVFLIGPGGVLLGGFARVELYRDRGRALGVIVHALHRARAGLRLPEVRGYEVAAAAQLLAIGGAAQLLALGGHAPRGAVAEGAHGLYGVVRGAAELLGPVPLAPEGVQQLGKAGVRAVHAPRAVLGNAHEGVVLRLPVELEEGGRKLASAHALNEGGERVGKAVPARGAVGELARYERREAGEAVQEPVRAVHAPRRGGYALRERALVQIEEAGLRGRLGVSVYHAGQQPPVGLLAEIQAAEGVYDVPGGVDEYDVRGPAHELRYEPHRALHAQLVAGGEANLAEALPARLSHGLYPRAAEVLPEQHTEHGRLIRVLVLPARVVQPRPGPGGGYDELLRPLAGVEREQYGVPRGLLYAVYSRAGHRPRELAHERGEQYGVQCHGVYLLCGIE